MSASLLSVRAAPLSAEAFAPFGDVVSAGLGTSRGWSANQGTAVRFDWCAKLFNGRAHARPNLAVYRSVPLPAPVALRLLERHPHSTQTFLPMIAARYLVCVAPAAAGGGPDLDGLRAFVCLPGQGVSYAAGTWHHPIVALDSPAEFAVLVWEDGTAADCEEQPLARPVLVELG